MSADVLRQAAALMRERAEAATPGPWEVKTDYLDAVTGEGGYPYISAPLMEVVAGVYDSDDQTAEHIASWHPAVALAVADWLDRDAEGWELLQDMGLPSDGSFETALAVARAYLGGAS